MTTGYVMFGFLEHTEDDMTNDVLLICFRFLRKNNKDNEKNNIIKHYFIFSK
jgi:hypothetical protein